MGKRSYRAAITEVRSTELRTRQITISPQLLASARWVKQVILLLLISRENSVRTQQVTFAIYAMGKESHNQERSFRLCSGGAAAPPTPYPIKFKLCLDHHYTPPSPSLWHHSVHHDSHKITVLVSPPRSRCIKCCENEEVNS